MSVLKPDYYIENFSHLDIQKLKQKQIRLLLCDIDNTLVAFDDPHSNLAVHDFIESVKAEGIQVALMSNNVAARTRRFGKDLGVQKIYSFCWKPMPFMYWKAMKDYACSPQETAILGDQLFTDILGGNLAGIYTILTKPIVERERTDTKVLRFFERRVFQNFEKNNIMKRGNFDD